MFISTARPTGRCRYDIPLQDDWFNTIAAITELSPACARDLKNEGFAILPGPVPNEHLPGLASAYDQAIIEAHPGDVSISETTRVHDFVNRGAAFDSLYIYPPVLEACYRTIRQPFRLSSMLARTLRPRSLAQKLHVDFARDAQGWPMAGFIFMIDEFRTDNGATCFVPGSHEFAATPTADEGLVQACGPAGSLIVYNGSVWHGHGANETAKPRRSIQGAFIRRDAKPATDFAPRMRPDTMGRIGPLARYLLAVSGPGTPPRP